MKKYIKMLGFVIFYIASYFAIFKTVLYFWSNVLPKNPLVGEWVQTNQLGIVVLNDILALPIFAVLVFLVKKQSILKVALFTRTSIQNILLSVIIGFGMGMFVINFFQLPICKHIPIFEELLSFIYESKILVFAGFVIIGTFFKEILFRGLIYNELEKAMHIYLAIFIHAVIYGALFFNFDLPLTLFGILGNIVVVLTYIITRSIWAPYTAQAANNVCIYLIRNYTGDFFENFRIPGLFISMIIISCALCYMFQIQNKKIKLNKKEIRTG